MAEEMSLVMSALKCSESDDALSIQHGAPLVDRKSTFQAHLAAVRTLDQV